jgi:hypothetical protein
MVTTNFAIVESAMIFFGTSFVRKTPQAWPLKLKTAQARVKDITDGRIVFSLDGTFPTLSMPQPQPTGTLDSAGPY